MNKRCYLLMTFMLVHVSALARAQSPNSVVAVEPNLVPLMKALVEERQLDIRVIGSEDVPFSITNQRLKMGISSKKWQDREIAQFQQKFGYKPTELYFTADVIAILSNEKHSGQKITLAEVKKLFGCNPSPEVIRWKNDDGSSGDPLVPFAIDKQLVMHEEFSSWVACDESSYVSTQFVPDLKAFKNKLSSQGGAIGYVVYTDQFENSHPLKIIDDLGESYDVNKETILSGRYPLASVYYMYLNLPPNREYFNEQEEFFVGLTLSDNSKAVLNQFGFISLPKEAIHRNRIRLRLEQPIIEGGYK